MTEIIDAIDDYTRGYFNTSPDYDLRAYGLCELMKKSAGGTEQPIPVRISDRSPVSIDDRFEVVTWIRLIGQVNYETNEEWSFGKNEARYATMNLRMFFAHRTSMGENVVFQFMQDFPSKLMVPDFQFVFISANQNIDTDHENIYNAELGNTVYEKHRVNWNVYAINLTVQFILCEGNYRILEDGTFRILE